MRQATGPTASVCAASLGQASAELSSGPCPCLSPEAQTSLATREWGLEASGEEPQPGHCCSRGGIRETCQWLLRRRRGLCGETLGGSSDTVW